jgi:hypothetical protein
MLLNGILDYVFNLNIYYVTKNEHVKNIKVKFNTMFEHQDLSFNHHPWDEFAIEILGFMISFGFIVL